MVLHKAKESNNPKLITIVVDCLRILSIGDATAKRELLNRHVPQLLVGVLHMDLHEDFHRNLLLCIHRLLKVLTGRPKQDRKC